MSTKIEWTDETWNPVTGCDKVSQGCKNCYAETIAHRFWGERKFTDVQMHPERLEIPLHWKKPRKIFVNSMSDLFHEDVPDEFIDKVWLRMIATKQHIYQILTKRPDRMLEYVDGLWALRFMHKPTEFDNVWLGVSCENQATADERIPLLLQTPAAVRFVSLEPLLGPIDIGYYLYGMPEQVSFETRATREMAMDAGDLAMEGMKLSGDEWVQTHPPLDWVIVGGESGPNARPMHPDWVRSIRDQCIEAGVPFFFKQWGAYSFAGHHVDNNGVRIMSSTVMKRVGKKAAGRLLDGREWNEYPEEK